MRRTVLLLIAMAGAGIAQAPSPLMREMLASHNVVRERLGIAPLKWSARLATVAQEWAASLLASKQFYHRPNSQYGENLFEIRGAAASSARVVNDWASESRDYDYRTNHCRGVCGHYTQIVWRDTREVGCAVALAGDREVWVCEYDPPGNYIGKRPY